MTSFARLRSIFWDLRPVWRRPAQRLKRCLSLLVYRLRCLWAPPPPRVVTSFTHPEEVFTHPAIQVWRPGGLEAADLSQQTETSWVQADRSPSNGHRFLLMIGDSDAAAWPPTLLESLLLSAAALPLSFLAAGRAEAAHHRFGPDTTLSSADGTPHGLPLLLLRATQTPGADTAVFGRAVPQITAEITTEITTEITAEVPAKPSSQKAAFTTSGPWFLRGDIPDGRLLYQAVRDPASVLRQLPEIPGPRTALLLLPFLAVGGAERLLFDLLAGWQGRYRLLVVTLEPHLAHLGHTVDRCRELTPHVYTLGDWLPREAHRGAVAHLLRRYQVETLVSWNGTVEFFDRVAAWHRAFPRLHICQQLYNHEGGWMERVTPRNLAAVDLHLAVNHHIARVLADRGVAPEKIEVVHHGVAVPTPHTGTHRNAERRRCRGLLGLPHDALVVGSFIRLHPQKRPLDIVQVARRLAARGIHFLLAGGGPLDAALDRELAREPLSNFTRLPLQADVETLYGAVDLCLSTSSYEGLPVFLLDGLARGLPCVTTAVGEIPALLAKGGGVLVEQPGDLQALCDGVLSFLDETHRHAEGERGRTTVRENFSLETFRNHYEALFFPPLKEIDG